MQGQADEDGRWQGHQVLRRLRAILKHGEGSPVELPRDLAIDIHSVLFEMKEFWDAWWGGMILKPRTLPINYTIKFPDELMHILSHNSAFIRNEARAEIHSQLFNDFEQYLAIPEDSIKIPRQLLERARFRIFLFFLMLRKIKKVNFLL